MQAENPWTIGALSGLGALVLSWLLNAATGGWRARGIVADLDKKITDQGAAIKEEMRKEHSDVAEEMRLEHDQMARQTGESLLAAREKMREMEIWGRDNYVRRVDFSEVVAGLNRQLELIASDMKSGFRDLRGDIQKMQARD